MPGRTQNTSGAKPLAATTRLPKPVILSGSIHSLLYRVRMRLFLYGTLRDPDLLATFAGRPLPLSPVILCGWRRVALRNSRYPTLQRARDRTEGVLAVVNSPTLARLAAYEGASYRLTRVTVYRAHRPAAAYAWIASGATRRPWSPPAP